MRVITQDGNILYSSNSNTFKTEDGKNLVYSDKKTINYQREVLDVCIFYKIGSGIIKRRLHNRTMVGRRINWKTKLCP